MLKFFKFKKEGYSHITILAIISTLVFFIAFIFGEGWGGNLGLNQSCLPYLGCSSGFFGYDAVEHFISGMMVIYIISLFFKKLPKYSLLGDKRWKNIIIFLSMIAFVGVMWEFIECAHDIFRSNVLHQVLINRKLNINLLDQPNNIDTMGDLFFSLCGSMIALFSIKSILGSNK